MTTATSRRVLIVEDNPGDARLLREMLVHQGTGAISECLYATSMAECERVLAADAVDVIILDLGLPDARGPEAVRRARVAAPRIPLVILTGMDDERLATVALQEGAQDYLIKGEIEPRSLMRSIRHAIERANLETALFFEKELAEVTLNAIADGVVRTDLDGHITYLNRVAELMTGWSSADAHGMAMSDVVRVVDTLDGSPARRPSGMRAERASVDTLLIRRDYSTLPIEESAVSIHGPDGEWARTISILRDVTATRAMASEITARIKAEAASVAKSEFLSGELRTPLNAILGFAQLLRERTLGSLNSREERYLDNISSAGKHLLDLVNDLLDIARIESRKMMIHMETVDVRLLLHPLIESTTLAANSKHIRFESDVPENMTVTLDLGRVRQMLYNLLSNAVKFTPEDGRVSLRVALTQSDVVFEVSDTGIGIPADQHDRVFGIFERLHDSSTAAGGSGLGLAVTRELVQLHGGTISFESIEGVGTTFRVVIENAACGFLGPERLLVVEDDRSTVELILALALAAGVGCEVVPTVAGALRSIDRQSPAAVAIALRLGDGRGELVEAHLQADPATSGIPTMMISAEDHDRGMSEIEITPRTLTGATPSTRLLYEIASSIRDGHPVSSSATVPATNKA